MASSDITVAALTAAPTLRGNKLAWTYSDPRNNALPNIGLDMVEVHASTTNDRATATKVGEGITDFLHAGLVEEATWYYWIKARDYLGGFGAWHPSGPTAGVSAKAIGMSGLAFGLANGKLVAAVASNALTIAIKTSAGNDPSVADPVYIAFRTAGLGGYSIIGLTSALSLTISPGSTMEVIANTAFRLWVEVFNDNATPRIGVVYLSSASILSTFGGPVNILVDDIVWSSTAEGGAGGANSSGTFYTNVAVSNKPIRVIGYLEWSNGLSTPGTWNVAPDPIVLQLNGRLPGDEVIAGGWVETGSPASSVIIPYDGTIPQKTEGTSWNTPTGFQVSSSNVIEIEVEAYVKFSTIGHVTIAIFDNAAGGSADAIVFGSVKINNANDCAYLRIKDVVHAGIYPSGFKVTFGGSVAGTVTINPAGTRMKSRVRTRELMG